MKIVHSYWSKPTFHAEQAYSNARKWGGWLSVKYALLSSCFSCLTARRFHRPVELHTDDSGFDLLIKVLELPYDTVELSLNTLQHANHQLWVLGKFIAFKQQQEPFIHIDNDVYLWKALNFYSDRKVLITQSRIPIPSQYKITLSDVFNTFRYIPECIYKQGIPDNMLVANAGIIGGNDLQFFQEYCALAQDFVDRNQDVLVRINLGYFNTILDEYLFTCLAQEQKKEVKYLINVPVDDSFKAVVRFHLVPFKDKYVHLVGFAKQNSYACEQLEMRLAYEFPDFYKKVLPVINERFPIMHKTSIDLKRQNELLEVFATVYKLSLPEFLQKKLGLSHSVILKEVTNPETGETNLFLNWKSNGLVSEEVKLESQDEILVFFESPISINELLQGLKEEDAELTPAMFEEQKDRLIDFVAEKIVIDGILEFEE